MIAKTSTRPLADITKAMPERRKRRKQRLFILLHVKNYTWYLAICQHF
jgi:hypothetical protein